MLLRPPVRLNLLPAIQGTKMGNSRPQPQLWPQPHREIQPRCKHRCRKQDQNYPVPIHILQHDKPLCTTKPDPNAESLKSTVIGIPDLAKPVMSLSITSCISLAWTIVSFVFSSSSRASPIQKPPHPTPENTSLNPGIFRSALLKASRIFSFALSVIVMFIVFSRFCIIL